jgi:hypothetical protein
VVVGLVASVDQFWSCCVDTGDCRCYLGYQDNQMSTTKPSKIISFGCMIALVFVILFVIAYVPWWVFGILTGLGVLYVLWDLCHYMLYGSELNGENK